VQQPRLERLAIIGIASAMGETVRDPALIFMVQVEGRGVVVGPGEQGRREQLGSESGLLGKRPRTGGLAVPPSLH